MPVTITNPPTVRKSWRVVRRGEPSKALVFDEADPIPTLKPGEVLVKVAAAALNPMYVTVSFKHPHKFICPPVSTGS